MLKRIIAISGIVILAGLYLATLIAAIFTSSATPQLFKACVYATLVVPVLFYGYLLMFRVLKARHDENTYDYEAEAAKALKNEDELTEFPDDDN